MTPIITKTIRVPLAIMAKVEASRGTASFNSWCVAALREKAERETITGPPRAS